MCQKIICAVGERKFKSESYIDAFLRGKDNMFVAHELTSDEYISSETELAVTLRLLAGGDFYDLGVIFNISFEHCDQIIYSVLKDWIIDRNIDKIDMEDYLDNLDEIKSVSRGVTKRFSGIFKEAIGAIDGWLVRISRPSLSKDGERNLTSYYSRKGFYALNANLLRGVG